MSALPVIFSRSVGQVRATPMQRFVAAGLAAGCLTLLLIAAWLDPLSNGLGTHQELGLPPCTFKMRTGLPCVSCGMTTAFTYFAHGNLLASAYVQPMGCLLALMAAFTVWIGFYCAITGKPIWRLARFLRLGRWVVPMIVFALIAWAWKITLTLQGWDGWR